MSTNRQIILDLSHIIDEEKVSLNRTVKLEGTFGETIVIFHDAASLLGKLIRNLQCGIISHLGEVAQDRAVNDFASENGDVAKPTSFARIETPHTTVIAMHVIDALSVSGWNRKKIRSHLYTPEEEINILSLIKASPVIKLRMEAIVLCPNGILGIKWQPHEQLISLRRELSTNGGIAKHGDNVITTTIGYFPDCRDTAREDIALVLQKVCQDNGLTLAQDITDHEAALTFEIRLSEAKFVKFARNDLHPDFISMSNLLLQDHLCRDFYNSDFPDELIQKKAVAVAEEQKRHLQQHHHAADPNILFAQTDMKNNPVSDASSAFGPSPAPGK